MKKKYIALTIIGIFLVSVIFGGYCAFKDGKGIHIGHALISKTGEFIFVDENGSPIRMGAADERKFSGITDGDRVLMLYGVVLESYPGQSRTNFCMKLSDGNIDDVNKDTVKQLKELGWIKGEKPFEQLKAGDISSITLSHMQYDIGIKQESLSQKEINTIVKLLKNLEFAHDEGAARQKQTAWITVEYTDGKTDTIVLMENSVGFNDKCYVATPTAGTLYDFVLERLDINF